MTSQAYSSHQQTRQQLDELDDLLQRMLTLPVNSSAAGPSHEPMSPDAFAPLPPTLPRTNVVPRPANSEPIVQAWRMTTPLATLEPPMALPVDTMPAPAPAPYPYSLVFGQPLPTEAAPPPIAEILVSPPTPPATPVSSAASIWANAQPVSPAASIWANTQPMPEHRPITLFNLPFFAINFLFDVLLYLLGPLGAWFRVPPGRSLLGWLGVLMILGAIGWAAYDWFAVDWTR